MDIEQLVGESGEILNGDRKGWRVKLEGEPGGYLILIWNETLATGFDDWVETLDELQEFIRDAGWEIRWDTKHPNQGR